ncbi:hypothetical protein DFH27DRAFT_606264 [Peziza echinospora]|nr:hypothetical protein DFH27DRAFT_606264 [Peziza echinospora]
MVQVMHGIPYCRIQRIASFVFRPHLRAIHTAVLVTQAHAHLSAIAAWPGLPTHAPRPPPPPSPTKPSPVPTRGHPGVESVQAAAVLAITTTTTSTTKAIPTQSPSERPFISRSDKPTPSALSAHPSSLPTPACLACCLSTHPPSPHNTPPARRPYTLPGPRQSNSTGTLPRVAAAAPVVIVANTSSTSSRSNSTAASVCASSSAAPSLQHTPRTGPSPQQPQLTAAAAASAASWWWNAANPLPLAESSSVTPSEARRHTKSAGHRAA